jgi:hypothetical protein
VRPQTDARDTHIIADAGRTLPHALRRVGLEEHTTVELAVLAGNDADLATGVWLCQVDLAPL